MERKLQDLKRRIRTRIRNLTDSQKAIANYIVENPRKVALSSIRDLEKELNISKSTIVRLAQALGYNGFYEMKSEFLQSIRHELDPINRFKTYFEQPTQDPDYLKIIADESVNNISSTLRLLDREQFRKAVELIKGASMVYTMGLGISTFLADLTAYLLGRVSIRAIHMNYGANTFAEQIVSFNKRDLIVAFSFRPYSEDTIEAARYAKEKGLNVVSLTDKATSPIVPFSDAALQVMVESMTISNSVIPVLALVYAMVGTIGYELKDRTLQTIESIEYVRRVHSGKKLTHPSKIS